MPRITPITRIMAACGRVGGHELHESHEWGNGLQGIHRLNFLRDHRVNLRALRGLKEFDFATNYAITHIGLLRGRGGG